MNALYTSGAYPTNVIRSIAVLVGEGNGINDVQRAREREVVEA